MPLSKAQRRHLKQLAHPLKPVVMIGQHGLTDAVLAETEQALEAHELIKVRVSVGDRDARSAVIDELERRSGAERVQTIGHIAILYRAPGNRPPRITLPKG